MQLPLTLLPDAGQQDQRPRRRLGGALQQARLQGVSEDGAAWAFGVWGVGWGGVGVCVVVVVVCVCGGGGGGANEGR